MKKKYLGLTGFQDIFTWGFQGRFKGYKGISEAFQKASENYQRIFETVQRRYIGVHRAFGGLLVRYVLEGGFLKDFEEDFEAFQEVLAVIGGFPRIGS